MNICYDESFWEEFEILMFDMDRMEQTEKDVLNVINLLEIKPNDKLLDVCCGFGRNSHFFAKNSIKTTGVDITKYYIDKAKEVSINKENPTFILSDILLYKEENEFDFAVNLYTSFGLLETEEDEILGIRNVYDSLKDGGKYLIDIQGKELTCRDFEKNIWFESGDTKVFLEYSIEESFTLLRSRWLYFKNDKMHEKTFNTRMYTALELATLLTSVGFKEVEIYGDYEGNPYDINAKRLIVVGIK